MIACHHLHTPRAVAAADEFSTDERLTRAWHDPDGCHWLDDQGRELGPFESLEDALAHMAGGAEPPSTRPGPGNAA